MTGYTVGFIFTTDLTQVALVTKTHPDWQKGRINGIGGKIEDGESSPACMVREVHEEAGLLTNESDWKLVIQMKRPAVYVDFYATRIADTTKVQTMTDEVIQWYPVSALPKEVLSNLTWLVPLSIDVYKDPSITGVEVIHSEKRT